MNPCISKGLLQNSIPSKCWNPPHSPYKSGRMLKTQRQISKNKYSKAEHPCKKQVLSFFTFSVPKNATPFWVEKDEIFAFRVAIWKRTSGGQRRDREERVLLKCWSFPASGSVWIYDCSWVRQMPPLPEWNDSSAEVLLAQKEGFQKRSFCVRQILHTYGSLCFSPRRRIWNTCFGVRSRNNLCSGNSPWW